MKNETQESTGDVLPSFLSQEFTPLWTGAFRATTSMSFSYIVQTRLLLVGDVAAIFHSQWI